MDYATKLVLFLLVSSRQLNPRYSGAAIPQTRLGAGCPAGGALTLTRASHVLLPQVIIVEKLTLVGEFLPVGIVLPAISPLLFGGVLEGTVISAACAAIGSSANFLVAQKFLRERALKLELFGQPPVGQAKWFTALSRNIEKDGFRAALLLRLAPVLPIPIDAHWYVCGLTPLKLTEFLPAYFLGALKATFLDAYLGSMLVGAALETDELAASSKGVLVAETCAGLPY